MFILYISGEPQIQSNFITQKIYEIIDSEQSDLSIKEHNEVIIEKLINKTTKILNKAGKHFKKPYNI